MTVHLRHRRNARRLGVAFWVNVSATALWTTMLPVTLVTGLKASVPFIAAISIYSLMVTHAVGAIAALSAKASSENAAKLHSPDEAPGP